VVEKTELVRQQGVRQCGREKRTSRKAGRAPV